MGRRLPDEVVYRIRVRIEAGEGVPAIAKAIEVARRTVYKIRVSLDLYGEPYAAYQGSITAETFELFVEQQVLSYCTLDFNPIEATFKDLKAWVKRNHRLAEEYESFEVFLHFVVSQSMGVNAGAHYREAGYIVN